MSESKNKTGIKTKRNVVAAEKKTATAVKKAAAVVKRRIKNAAAGVSVQEKTADKTAAAKAVKVSKADLKRPEYFFNRELSWLKFNLRVLREAEVKTTPILERLKFIAITSSNLDEFFMVRVAGLWDQYENGVTSKDPSGLTVREQLRMISQAAHEQMKLESKIPGGSEKSRRTADQNHRRMQRRRERVAGELLSGSGVPGADAHGGGCLPSVPVPGQ